MNPDRLVDNRSPMEVRALPMPDRHGRDVIVVIAKMTWDVSPVGAVRIARPGAVIRIDDTRRGDGALSSVRYPSDRVVERPGTDVLLVATAQPSAARAGAPAATHQDVTLRVAAAHALLEKTLRVHGPRVWARAATGVAPGPSRAVAPTPISYELAYGGVDETDPEERLVEWRNPAGTGVARERLALVGLPAPVVEDPRAPIGSRAQAPAGFGPIPANWLPRSQYAGTFDAAWRRDRAPVAPADQDPHYGSCAPPDQWSSKPLFGDEPIEVVGATVDGAWRFKLPRHAACFTSWLRGDERRHETHLDTLLVDADLGRVELAWRAAIRVPRRVDDLERVMVHMEPQIAVELSDELRDRIGLGRTS
jgi:hypothetical protein